MNYLDIEKNLPIQYDKNKNELLIVLPKNIKIKFLNDLNIITENEFNVLSFGQMNICSVDNNIHIDSVNAAIHLNSQRAKQIKEIKKLIINNINCLENKKNILNNLLNTL